MTHRTKCYLSRNDRCLHKVPKPHQQQPGGSTRHHRARCLTTSQGAIRAHSNKIGSGCLLCLPDPASAALAASPELGLSVRQQGIQLPLEDDDPSKFTGVCCMLNSPLLQAARTASRSKEVKTPVLSSPELVGLGVTLCDLWRDSMQGRRWGDF